MLVVPAVQVPHPPTEGSDRDYCRKYDHEMARRFAIKDQVWAKSDQELQELVDSDAPVLARHYAARALNHREGLRFTS